MISSSAARQHLKNVIGLVSLALKFSAGQDVGSIQAEYVDTIGVAMFNYLNSDQPITSFRNIFRRAVNDAFTFAFYAGWADGGGGGELSGEAISYLNGRIESEINFANELFDSLRDLRSNPDVSQKDKEAWADARAESYGGAVLSVYNEAKMMASKDKVGQWRLGATEEHCDTCSMLASDPPHPLSWFTSQGYIPRQPGSQTLECHGYHCDCGIFAEDGERLI